MNAIQRIENFSLPTTLQRVATAIGTLAVLTAGSSTMNAQTTSNPTSSKTQLATFGGGCFWCVEAVFERLDGVRSAVSGYAGGTTPNPTYKQVCSGETGHAEVIQIEFDPAKISFEKLLEVFWHAHDPTTLNRQGADEGTQYRSIILYHDEAQKAAAEKSKREHQKGVFGRIVTEIVPLSKFYPAEDYHQGYYQANGRAPYCSIVIRPKLEKLEKAGVIKKK